MTQRILRVVCLVAACMVASSCSATRPSVRPIDRGEGKLKEIVLRETVTTVRTRGILGVKWVEGLAAGTYKPEAQDDDGVYFRGPPGCAIILGGKLADAYLATGVVPTAKERSAAGVWVGDRGGLWVPKPGVEKPPRIYYYKDMTGSVASSGEAGLIGSVAAHSIDGELTLGPTVDDPRILGAL